MCEEEEEEEEDHKWIEIPNNFAVYIASTHLHKQILGNLATSLSR